MAAECNGQNFGPLNFVDAHEHVRTMFTVGAVEHYNAQSAKSAFFVCSTVLGLTRDSITGSSLR